jgi:hypothetical protein
VKITVIMTGQEQHRMTERVGQLVRARASKPAPPGDDDPPSSTAPTRQPPRRTRDRRS